MRRSNSASRGATTADRLPTGSDGSAPSLCECDMTDSWEAPVDDLSESKHVVGHDVSFHVVVSKSVESAGCTAKLEGDGDVGV